MHSQCHEHAVAAQACLRYKLLHFLHVSESSDTGSTCADYSVLRAQASGTQPYPEIANNTYSYHRSQDNHVDLGVAQQD